MSAGQLAAFLGVSLVVIVTPGQDTALTIRNTLAGGRHGGLQTALGVVSGQVVWALGTSFGLAAVLVASRPAFTALRLLGAAYLVLLGAQALLASLRRCDQGRVAIPSRGHAPFRQGILSNLGNPKMAVFYTSLLPQFGSSFGGMLTLGVLFALLTLAWLSAYALVVARAASLLSRPAVRRTLDAVTGAVLVAFGVRLAAER